MTQGSYHGDAPTQQCAALQPENARVGTPERLAPALLIPIGQMRNHIVSISLLSLVASTLACGEADRLRGESSTVPTCVEPSVRKTDWQNPLTRLALATGGPVHSGIDVVARPGEAFELEGKFAYGPASKDLEDEAVTAFLETDPDGCGWTRLDTTLTDSDGRARVTVPAGTLTEPGMYRFRYAVHGDQSELEANVFVLAPDTRAVVFDLDGTITTSDLQLAGDVVVYTVGSSSELLFELAGSPLSKSQWLFGLERVTDEPEAYPGAFDLVHYYAEQGYLPIFITGRPYLFDAVTREWMGEHLPAGPLFTTQDVELSMPENVAGYKAAHIDALEALGVRIEAAYGNASTDVCGYAQAGLSPASTYIIGENAGSACPGFAATQAIGDYPSHLEALQAAAR